MIDCGGPVWATMPVLISCPSPALSIRNINVHLKFFAVLLIESDHMINGKLKGSYDCGARDNVIGLAKSINKHSNF